MNRIYKVIWSKAKNCYVVASELAKNHTKGSRSRSVRVTAAQTLTAFLISAETLYESGSLLDLNISHTSHLQNCCCKSLFALI